MHLYSDIGRARSLKLIKLAHIYELKGLFVACCTRIIGELSVQNFVESFQVFNRYEIQQGFDDLVQFGKENLSELQRLDSFNELPYLFRFGHLRSPNAK